MGLPFEKVSVGQGIRNKRGTLPPRRRLDHQRVTAAFDPETIARVTESVARRLQPSITPTPINLHVRVLQRSRPLAGAHIEWSGQVDTLGEETSIRTNRDGRAIATLSPVSIRGLTAIDMTVTDQDGFRTTLSGIRVGVSGTQRVTSGDIVLEVKLLGEETPLERTGPEPRRRRRVRLAVTGTAGQLKRAVPLLQERVCFDVRAALFVDREKRPVKVGKKLQARPLSKEALKSLSDIDAVIDFSGHPDLMALKEAAVRGEKPAGPVIVKADEAWLD
ncbi:MAG: hypothetical protein ACFFCW_11625 [Candidatus Hodarchaeota archaeon]